MMLKIKLIGVLVSICLCSVDAVSQCTPDNSLTEFGAYSSLGKNKIPSAWVDSTYKESLTIVVPAEIQGFKINQVTLKEAPDIYTGLSYTCNPSNCIYPGGANGCIEISGTATDSKQANQKVVTLKLFVETDIVNFDTNIAVEFDLLDSASLSIQTNQLVEHAIYPNPANEAITLDIGKEVYKTLSVEILNLEGENVKAFNFSSNEKMIELPIKEIENGLYLIKYTIDDKVLFKKMTIQH